MPVSDLYVVEFLVQATSSASDPLCWRDCESGAHQTSIHGVVIELYPAPSRAGSVLCIEFSFGGDKAYIQEPRYSTIFARKYKDEDDTRLAALMKKLAALVSKQCVERRSHAPEIRETILRQLLFGGG